MADAPAKAPASKSAFGFLGRKVFGNRVPIWVLAVGAVGAWYWYSHRKGAAGTQTDPAGNTCSAVNPATGYCPGTPEDLAAQQSNAGTDTTGTGTGGTGTDQSGGSAGGTAGGGTTGTDTGTGGLLTWTDQSGTQTGTADDFAAAFAATGTNAGTIVPGGTGQPIPLQPGQSYTDAGPPPSPAAKPGAQNGHAKHLAHVAHVQHLKHVAATRKQPAKKTPR